ncbi:MAG: SpoIIE family protein phosphatase [Spirochaetales bacterium]|nr:SpoIIE family protein phosphatase [Spirochaetales bacterium]
MGLTIFTYLAAIVMVITAFRTKRLGSGTGSTAFKLGALASAAYAVCLATGYLLAADNQDMALSLLRWAGALALASYAAFFRMALTYPYARKIYLVDLALTVLVGIAVWRFVYTADFLESVRRIELEYIRFEGAAHGLLSTLGAALALATTVLFLIRGLTTASRMYKQHLFVLTVGLAVSVAYGYILAIYFPGQGKNVVYPLAGLSALPAILAGYYALTATRLFHVGTLAKSTLTYGLLIVFFGLPLGVVVGVLLMFRLDMLAFVLGVGVLGFLMFGRWAEGFLKGRFGSARDEEAREELETAIAHLDLSAGRDEVLGKLSEIMADAFGSSWFMAISENESGGLSRVFPGAEEEELAASDSPIVPVLTALDRSVVLKTDVIADPAFADSKTAIFGFMDALGSEALILAREGRRIVGLFAFGPKRNGRDYNALDYEAFLAIHGKLFVVAYYVRHVARESLLSTVEKEIGLADQIVKSVQESIAPIDYPGVDVSFVCRSTRQLGGDLYDAVRLSEHRWFFVVGDVSGKGLNASMSMIILKSMIRTLLREEKDFIKLVSRTNQFIKDHLPRGTFFAGVFGFLALDKRSIYFINCGIPAIFFRSPSLDAIIEVQGEGKMLGFVRNLEPHLKTRRLDLPVNSGLVISTDGIIEAESIRGEHYGKERLVRILTENRGAPAADIVDSVIRSATSFTDGRLEDDITLLAINFHGHKEKTS